jgi:protein tyrosine phosphatase (PTP) superfamily phosphohydrolase (DUF442 family)
MDMVKIDDAKEGMIIIEEILNEQGNVFLKEGTVLTKDMIRKLKSLGISGVCVENPEKNGSPDNMSPAASTELKELEYRFSNVRGDAIMEEIMVAVKEYITEKGSSDGIH